MSLDLPHVIVESDSWEVVNLLCNQDIRSHRYAQVAADILHLQEAHGSLVFQHAPRESNSLADYLAKIGLSLEYGTHYFDSPFGECHSLLARDIGSNFSIVASLS